MTSIGCTDRRGGKRAKITKKREAIRIMKMNIIFKNYKLIPNLSRLQLPLSKQIRSYATYFDKKQE